MDDLISRQAAIDALIELYEYQRDIDPTEAADLVRQGIYLAEKKIEQLPSAQLELANNSPKVGKKNGEWIPCSERLPEQYGNYLVSYRTDDFESDIGTFDPDRINSDTGEWSACDANGFYWVASKGLEVIAWMPLPEPYRAERRADEKKDI